MTATANLLTRNDTLLGVCEGLGDEFGFNANYLRVVLAALLLWNAAVVVGVYVALGVVLAIGRRIWPAQTEPEEAASPATKLAGNDAAPSPLAEAA